MSNTSKTTLNKARRAVNFGTLYVQAIVVVDAPYVSDGAAVISLTLENETRDVDPNEIEGLVEAEVLGRLGAAKVRGVEVKALDWDFVPCTACVSREVNGGWGPSHQASVRCQSGGRAHCTCSTCF